jgi:formylglycine-generating enzyme required for sulfatase activity
VFGFGGFLSMTILLATTTAALAQNPTVVNEQIALQLGAIQMGYTTPFVLTASSDATVKQQACNALVQGRKAMAATAAAPGVNVQGAVNVPPVDSVEFRDQLYQAVENVVTTPLKATVSGVATLVGGKKVSARAYLMPPPNSWMVPVPFALEARSCVESQDTELRAALVAAGLIFPNPEPEWTSMVTVQGGTLPQSSELSGQTVSTFQIGKYEVTVAEWQSVRAWAVANGYGDLAGVGSGNAANLPVQSVSWYDAVKWCNAKSEKEGLTPVYQANGTYRTGEFGYEGSSAVTANPSANGYRLPSEAEWEWAARGGVSSQGYTYSGSDDVNAVAWTGDNSGYTAHRIGTKAANELGIFDMSGNAWEWVFDAYDGSTRRIRGCSWKNFADYVTVASLDAYYPDFRSLDIGFRLARSSGQ